MRSGLLALLLLAAVPAAWAAGYDAIAIDDNIAGAKGTGDYAVGQAATAREARRIAMSNCTAGGNIACTVKLTFRQCGAYAAAPPRWSGKGTGPTEQTATDAAMKACGNQSCRLVVADCVNAPLRPPR